MEGADGNHRFHSRRHLDLGHQQVARYPRLSDSMLIPKLINISEGIDELGRKRRGRNCYAFLFSANLGTTTFTPLLHLSYSQKKAIDLLSNGG